MKNKYFPCQIVEHEGYSSIILSSFHYFDHYEDMDIGGGYHVEKLAQQLIRQHQIPKGIKFDSEAGMFCAYAENVNLLERLCSLFRDITGTEDQFAKTDLSLSISYKEAEALLLKGFVYALDTEIQKQFLSKVPFPSLSAKQTTHWEALQHGTDEAITIAAKKMNAEARTLTRNWNHYLSHPNLIKAFLRAIDHTESAKVQQELLWALAFICDRHLPDLRTRPYFVNALSSKQATTRWIGLMGLGNLYDYSKADIIPLLEDRSKKVRDKAAVLFNAETPQTFPVWMFDLE